MAPESANSRIGQRVHSARLRHPAMTAKHVADFLGIEESAYLAIEAGQFRPTGEQVILLADLMNVPPSWFLQG